MTIKKNHKIKKLKTCPKLSAPKVRASGALQGILIKIRDYNGETKRDGIIEIELSQRVFNSRNAGARTRATVTPYDGDEETSPRARLCSWALGLKLCEQRASPKLQ